MSHTFTLILTSLQRPPSHNGNGILIPFKLKNIKPLHNGQLINDRRRVYTNRNFFIMKRDETCYSLFLSSVLIYTFYIFYICSNKHFWKRRQKWCTPLEKKMCHFTPSSPVTVTSLQRATFFCPQERFHCI